MRLKVSPGNSPELVVPPGTPPRAVRRMIEGNREWILRKHREMEAVAGRRTLGLDRPGFAWVHGEAIPVASVAGSRPRAELRRGRLEVAGPSPAASVERWYRREARARLAAQAGADAPSLGVTLGRISVRDQRTRWGSCSPRGDLSFSWRLLLAPHSVLRYVVIHELCHVTELNHSPRFWALLDDALPGWRTEAAWLREHSYELGAYDPGTAVSRRLGAAA